MIQLPQWLPPLIRLTQYGGNWDRYVEALYAFYKQDFVDSRPEFQGLPVMRRSRPVEQGKEACFWHLVSEGKNEQDRVPDPRRCERIRWPRPVIEHAEEPTLKIWRNKRKSQKRVCIWCEATDYLVILDVRAGYFLLCTAYLVTQPHRRRKLQEEYEAFVKANAALD